MVGRFVLLSIALVVFALHLEGDTGASGVVTDDGAAKIQATKTIPGGGVNPGAGGTRSGSSGPAAPAYPDPTGTCPDAITPCGLNPVAKTAAPAAPPAAGTPAVTLADLAEFRPVAVALASEPAGWGVVGLDTNVVAPAATQVLTGTLLGRPASVRFTPVAWVWDYGDGSTRTTTTGGASWERAGAREFAPTSTSHVYAARGDYALTVRVRYVAEYSWDGSTFARIDGVVTGPLSTANLHIVIESTVLVGGDCGAGSSAAGCG